MADGEGRSAGERGSEPSGAAPPPPGTAVPPPAWDQSPPQPPASVPPPAWSQPPAWGQPPAQQDTAPAGRSGGMAWGAGQGDGHADGQGAHTGLADYPGGTGWSTAPAGPGGAAPMPGTRRRRFPLVLRGLVALGVAGFAVIGLLSQADRDESGAISESGTLDVLDLQIGDCFNDPVAEDATEAPISDVDAVPCAEAHDLEVFHVVDHPAGPDEAYVGDEALSTFAQQSCLAAFEPYVGRAYDDSAVYFSTVNPSEGTWEQGDREVLCNLYVPDERVPGTLRDSGR